MVLRVLIRPGSYTAGNQTIGAKGQLDPQIPNTEVEWITRETGNVILQAVLVHVEDEEVSGKKEDEEEEEEEDAACKSSQYRK